MPNIEPLGAIALSRIMDIVTASIQRMESEGIDQWNVRYPNREIFEQDIAKGTLHGYVDNDQLQGVICLNEEQSPEYYGLPWITAGDKVLVIHRLVVHPEMQHQGIARQLMDYAENHAEKHGYTSIRLDVYSGNPYAIRLYEKRGFQRVGEVRFPGRRLPFYCYELPLNDKKP